MMSEIEELKALLPGDVEDMRLLMCQLSPRLQLAAALLEQVVDERMPNEKKALLNWAAENQKDW